jgi:hypothetical protein
MNSAVRAGARAATRAVVWLALGATIWLILASLAFLWLSGGLSDPRIPAFSRPYAWARYALYFGRDLWESLYLILAAVMAATPLIIVVRLQFRSQFKARPLYGETRPASHSEMRESGLAIRRKL